MHGNVESLCGIEQKDNNSNKKGILVKKITFEFSCKKNLIMFHQLKILCHLLDCLLRTKFHLK